MLAEETLISQQPTAAKEIECLYGAQVSLCYQCKRCTSGCPVADEMDLRPHQLVRTVQLGAADSLLASGAIWSCVGCYLCSTRCPQQVPVVEMIYSLKGLALRRGVLPRRASTPAFIRAFASSVERYGRSREVYMLARYFLATDPRKAMKQAPAGLRLFLQGRMPLWGGGFRGRKQVRAMLRGVRRSGGAE